VLQGNMWHAGHDLSFTPPRDKRYQAAEYEPKKSCDIPWYINPGHSPKVGPLS
jgi:hypothetical protein